MSQLIRIRDELYDALVERKRKYDSFSDVIYQMLTELEEYEEEEDDE